MVASINDILAQKIYKAIEDKGEALKKIGSCLSKLEEGKIKKPVHIEIIEEEEKEEWDERDKADHERNKQFEKLIMDTVAMKENMEKMRLAFCKTQGMDDCLYNMGGLSSKFPITLPPKFKISNAENFDGTRDPKKHVRRYISIIEMKGLDKKQTWHSFPLSLTEDASRWYYSLDPSKTKVWNELVELFVY